MSAPGHEPSAHSFTLSSSGGEGRGEEAGFSTVHGEGRGEREQRVQTKSRVRLHGRFLSSLYDPTSRIEPMSRLPILPLPQGEGRGQGEGRVRAPKLDARDDRFMKRAGVRIPRT